MVSNDTTPAKKRLRLRAEKWTSVPLKVKPHRSMTRAMLSTMVQGLTRVHFSAQFSTFRGIGLVGTDDFSDKTAQVELRSGGLRERDASACMRRHQAFALAPAVGDCGVCEALPWSCAPPSSCQSPPGSCPALRPRVHTPQPPPHVSFQHLVKKRHQAGPLSCDESVTRSDVTSKNLSQLFKVFHKGNTCAFVEKT